MSVAPLARHPAPASPPRPILIAAGFLVALAIMAALLGRLTGIGTGLPPLAPVAESQDLRFIDGSDGSILVRRAMDDRLVYVIAPETNHFIRVTLRGLARTRRSASVGPEPPFRLSRRIDGKTVLEDPSTRRWMELEAFGKPNAAAFAAVLDAALTAK
ncbi:MAG: phosphonate-binding protein [Methylobacteriaceae bacterium]|nr:phosphonate-binding protein [Methylobacteriaceae bacterium]